MMTYDEAIRELRQCQTELEEAAKLLHGPYPGVASIYKAAAKRLAKKLDS